MYLDEFKTRLVKDWSGSLFSLSSVRKIHPRAKEYLHRLIKNDDIKHVTWGCTGFQQVIMMLGIS